VTNLLKKKIPITIERTQTGYSAYADTLPVFTTSATIAELYENVLEALNLYYEDQDIDLTTANLKLQLDLQQFFQHYRVLNASFLANRIGMNPALLSQYVQGIKRPSAKQTRRILQGIQNIGKELADLEFI
jgi:predicted RNase H-like HicB family nuclease